MKKYLKTISYIIVSILVGITAVYAGTLTPPGAPAKTMKSLTDLYELINTGANTPSTDFTTPTAVSSTMHSLGDIYDLMKDKIDDIDASTILTGNTILGVEGTATAGTSGYEFPSKPLQTTLGTSNYCTDATGAVISCTGTGQDGEFNAGQPHDYTDNGDGTVTDNATGLMWQKCTVGLSGEDCATGTATTQASWTAALATCNDLSLAGHTDWKLPNINELESIINRQYVNPAIDRTTFPNTQSGNYWSSSTYVGSQSIAWLVNFYSGNTSVNGKTNSGLLARCVR